MVIRGVDELDALALRLGVNSGLGEDRGATERVAVVLYSGTTGSPKGAALTHRALSASLAGWRPRPGC